jgi:Zn-dependent peptidase ImmA (M78 family)
MSDKKDVARQKARDLIKRFGIKSLPVNVERIARSLEVKVEFSPFDDGLSGMALIKDGVPVIGVNSQHHPNRQRFTIAHELAHIVLHPEELTKAVHVDKGSLRRDRVSAQGTDDLEIEANAFAAELLMPEELLSAALDEKLDLEDPQVLESLANRFRVSLIALQHRLHI